MRATASAADVARPSHIKPSGDRQLDVYAIDKRKPSATNPHAAFTPIGIQSIQKKRRSGRAA